MGSFAHLLLGLSNHNKVVLWPRFEGGARFNLHKKTCCMCGSLQKRGGVVGTFQLALYWKCGFHMLNTWKWLDIFEHVFVFKSCDIWIHWRIWMLSILLKQNWNWLYSFELHNVRFSFATADYYNFRFSFATANYCGLQVNSGLQPPTRWEPFVASTMLRCPEPTKERVEPKIHSTIAIEITHLTRFALLLLLRILRYMWRNHVTTWAQANNSGRNWDLNKIRFSICIISCNRVFLWIWIWKT